jgi:hypothetical protein
MLGPYINTEDGKNAARKRLAQLCETTIKDTNRKLEESIQELVRNKNRHLCEDLANGTSFKDTKGPNLFEFKIEAEYNPEVAEKIRESEEEGKQSEVYVVCVRTLDKESQEPWKTQFLWYRMSNELLTWPYGVGKDDFTTCLSFESVQKFVTNCVLREEQEDGDNSLLVIEEIGDRREIFQIKDGDDVLRFRTIKKVFANPQ